MGERGPIPKPEAMRRRRNESAGPVDRAASGRAFRRPPAANRKWHPVARRWFEALARSGQAIFYEPSDWATAYLVAESMSRDLLPQYVGTTDDGKVIEAVLPLKGASLSAYLRAFSSLLVTEGDRRRSRLELLRAGEEDPTAESAVTRIDEYRNRAGGDRSG